MNARTPTLFIGHGSPMNAITDNAFAAEWRAISERISTPKAILCVSAHWETDLPEVCVANPPETIHDFYGFPPELHAVRYPAPGAPGLAERVSDLSSRAVTSTAKWGLDHGAWQILVHLFPKADVPVAQLSLARTMSMAEHFEFAKQLRKLREEDVLILASGNIVHNLRLMSRGATPAWASAFDAYVRDAIASGDDERLIHFEGAGESANAAVPTREHYLPLLYVAATRFEDEAPRFHTEGFDLGSISMRSVSYGLTA
jgi:4,5-DOPA dioxygenase extradiol